VAHPTQVGKGCFGLDDSQVRTYTALYRRLVLSMATLAVCAVTAAAARPRTTLLPPPPRRPDERPPADPGLIPLTVAEVNAYPACSPAPGRPPVTTCTGPGGGAATKPEPDGFTSAPVSSGRQQSHDQITNYGCRNWQDAGVAGDDVAVQRLRDAVARLREETRGRVLIGRSHEEADEVAGTVATDDAVGFDPFPLLRAFHDCGGKVVVISQVAGIMHGSREPAGDLDLLWGGQCAASVGSDRGVRVSLGWPGR
jgi:hypothetical protein